MYGYEDAVAEFATIKRIKYEDREKIIDIFRKLSNYENTNADVRLLCGLMSDITNVTTNSLLSSCRQPRVAEARCIIYKFLRSELSYSFAEIGKEFGRNHATVLTGLSRMELYTSYFDKERERVERIYEELKRNYYATKNIDIDTDK